MNNKILSKIKIAVNKYSDYLSACDKIAREALKHIDWNDSVSCEYYPADGIMYRNRRTRLFHFHIF